jgi:predicted AAA+ superfamily ATPase
MKAKMMNYIHRQLEKRLLELAAHFPVIVLVGARQVGKTTLLKTLLPAANYVVFDPAIDVEHARQDPDLFLQNHPCPLILDEIQYAPEVVAAIKRHIDRNRQPGQFLLTGSQQWQVMRNLTESLAGRAVILQLDGFSFREWQNATDIRSGWLDRWLKDPSGLTTGFQPPAASPPLSLLEYLFRGSLPDAVTLPLEVLRDYHNSYLRTYVERDARSFANVSDAQLFGRFHRLLAALTAQEVNYAHLGREIGLSPNTAREWLSILQATFQWFETPAYHTNLLKRVSSKPKGYFFDTGLACAGQFISSPEALASHPLLGALFETLVVSEVRKQSGTMPAPPQLFHWRAHSGAEVDLLLERDGKLFPLEIKMTSNPSGYDVRPMNTLRKTLPPGTVAPGLLVCCIESPRQLNDAGDTAIPWHFS